MPGISPNGTSNEETTRISSDPDSTESVLPWNSEERSAYVRSLGVATGSHEQSALLLLEDAISDAPLPPPWVMCRDDTGQAFWWEQVTQESSWKHPLESTLRELSGVIHACLSLDLRSREPCLDSLKVAWEQESKNQLDQWCRASDNNGREYYWHGETKEVTWEHPGERILPVYYMKMKFLERLREVETEGDKNKKESMYSFQAELGHLDTDMKHKALPGGLAIADIGRKTAGGSWWWGCSPIKYMGDEASDQAYVKGTLEGRQLYGECAEKARKEITDLPDLRKGKEDSQETTQKALAAS